MKYAATFCAECGAMFRAGDANYSACIEHPLRVGLVSLPSDAQLRRERIDRSIAGVFSSLMIGEPK